MTFSNTNSAAVEYLESNLFCDGSMLWSTTAEVESLWDFRKCCFNEAVRVNVRIHNGHLIFMIDSGVDERVDDVAVVKLCVAKNYDQ